MNKSKELEKSKYDHRLIIESEKLPNLAYEIRERAICAMAFQGGGVNRMYGSIPQMREFAKELIQICDTWESVRT